MKESGLGKNDAMQKSIEINTLGQIIKPGEYFSVHCPDDIHYVTVEYQVIGGDAEVKAINIANSDDNEFELGVSVNTDEIPFAHLRIGESLLVPEGSSIQIMNNFLGRDAVFKFESNNDKTVLKVVYLDNQEPADPR